MSKKLNGKYLIISVAFGLVFSILASLCSFNAECNNIRENVLRIHILANSNSNSDQALKLKVRDGLLTLSNSVFANCKSREEAEQKAKENIDLFKKKAETIVKQEGYNYSVNITLGKSDFNTRHYKNFSLPAGTYNALKVVLGKGEGKNWWCVMFPPVCVPSASNSEIGDVLTEKDTEIVQNEVKYKCRFKAVEIYECVCSFFKEKFSL